MRKIKFRAWSKSKCMMAMDVHNEYDTITGVNFYKNGSRTNCEPGKESFGCYLSDPDYVVMQFTGLKDKNGKEIYEGDIVKLVHDLDNDVEFIKVYFNDGAFLVDCDFGEGDMAPIGWALESWDAGGDIAEVIGNIYENPELLKGE